MARIFITGSSDGLGQMTAQQLANEGHQVVLHARNKARGQDALANVSRAETVLIADLSSIEETKHLASVVNDLGQFDVIIHNAGIYQGSSELIATVNTLAPYILTCLIHPPKRLIYVSSGMHLQGSVQLDQLRGDLNGISYSDSKLQLVILSRAVARLWPWVYSNAVDPGWVPTKMGGKSAPDNLVKGFQTQTWLAVSNDPRAKVNGHYFYHQKTKNAQSITADLMIQDHFLSICEEVTGIVFPVGK